MIERLKTAGAVVLFFGITTVAVIVHGIRRFRMTPHQRAIDSWKSRSLI